MNQKGFANIVLVIIVVVLVGLVGYFAFMRKQMPTTTTTGQVPQIVNKNAETRRTYQSLSKEEQMLFSKDTKSLQQLFVMQIALSLYHKDYKDYPQDISTLIPKYLPTTAEQSGAYNSDQFHYFRCSLEDFHLGVSLYFNHDPEPGSDNKALWLARDLDKKVCTNDPIQFEDDSKCFSSDIGNHCFDLGKENVDLTP